MQLPLLVLLAAWASPRCADVRADAAPSADQSSRLRTKWQVSLREARLRDGNKAGNTKQLLYCRIGIGYHLQILPNGTVGGVHEHTEYSWLKVFAMEQGVVGVQGLESGLYLSMNKDGISHGLSQFTPDCLFRESLEENHYTTYSSLSYPGFYLALSPKGGARRGGSVSKEQPCTHFLPRRVLPQAENSPH
ncbi:fibroblast growth factor 4 [Conger conger]|uniref:fibroblast growth factor 4 n=1 Tax=Conger conger TaxID=82655 RepID=UPI002A5A3621|nr:fibroblast growth factor 4 [Conger conger]